MWRRISAWVRDLMIGPRLKAAIRENDAAADRLDSALREVMRK